MPSFDTTTPVVVLKFDQNALHHGGLGVIRGLGRFGIPVHCVHESRLAPAAHSRYVRGRWLWRAEPADVGTVLAGLRRVGEHLGRPAVLLPTDDAGAIFLAEHGAPLREWFCFPDPPSHLPRQVAGKFTLHQLCRELGVPSAEAELVEEWQQARAFAERVGFPMVGKLAEPWADHPQQCPSTTIVRSRQQLADLHRASGGGLLLQEYLPGAPGGDWFFHGYCTTDGRCAPGFTGVKERSYPAHSGLTSLGRCADNPELARLATDLLARVGFRGIVDLDFRQDARDGQYKLLDFNPRLGAQFRLFADAGGADLALAAYLDLTGQLPATGSPRPGRRFVVENYDPVAALGYWRRGELGPLSWRRSLRGVEERAWFARDDLMPFALMCLWMGWRAATRRFRSGPRPPTPRPRFRPGRGSAETGGGPRHRPEPLQDTVQEDWI
jgi:predicted ATP-grasp superfamily ATP-dependent carboligase